MPPPAWLDASSIHARPVHENKCRRDSCRAARDVAFRRARKVPDTFDAEVKYVEVAVKRHAIARPGQRDELQEPPVVTAWIIGRRPTDHEACNDQFPAPDAGALQIGLAAAH